MKTITVRTITGICMALLFLPLVLIGSWPFLIFALIISYLAGFELLTALAKREPYFKQIRFSMPGLSCLFILAGYFNPSFLIPISVLFLLGAGCLALALKSKALNAFFVLFAILYIGLGFWTATKINFFSPAGFPLPFPTAGFFLLMYLVGTISFTDIGAYLIGSMWGRRKLCPLISPKKTVEGAIGGTVIGTLLGTILFFIFEKSLGYLFLINSMTFRVAFIAMISLLLSVTGQLGDLIASNLKRFFGIKDYGHIFPGHGGVMDRFDSFLSASMVFYVLLFFLGVSL